MKICYVVPDLGGGGAQKQLYELLAKLDRSIFESVVINMHEELTADWFKQVGVRLIGLDYRGPGDVAKFLRLGRILSAEKPDILHCLLTSGNFYGLLASITAAVPVRIAGERSFATRFQGFRRAVYPRVLSLADVIVTNSRRNQRWLMDTYALPQAKVTVIPNGCRLPVSIGSAAVQMKRQALGVGADQFAVATVTHLTPEKDVECLIRAASRVAAAGVDVKVIVVGEGPRLQSVQELIRTLDLGSRVALTGQLPHPEALMVTQLCDTFVLPSRYEGMPNALMEAMAHGRPCVASNVGGVPELLEDGQTGLRFESGDDEALAERILRLARDPALRQRLGEAARRKVTAEFTVETMVERHEDLYRSLMNARRSRRSPVAAL